MKNLLAVIKGRIKKWRPRPRAPVTRDEVNLQLWGLGLTVRRETTVEIPAELTVVIPRAEGRTACEDNGTNRCQGELVLSSITVVIAPRHPTEHGGGSPAAPARLRKH